MISGLYIFRNNPVLRNESWSKQHVIGVIQFIVRSPCSGRNSVHAMGAFQVLDSSPELMESFIRHWSPRAGIQF